MRPAQSQESQEVYKTICENLRHTLASIKSYSKLNMMGDAKASYFTIGELRSLITDQAIKTQRKKGILLALNLVFMVPA